MKGVSEVIAIILILMITISLAGLAYMFMSTTMSDVTTSAGSTVDATTSSMLTSFTIESLDVAKVYVRNTGQNPITSLSVYVNDEPAIFNATTPIASGAVGTVTIYSFIPNGATVKVVSPSGFSASKVARPCANAVGCWDFDEGSGNYTHDSSPNGNTGTLVNGPVWTSGRYGNAIQFDGVNDYVIATNSSVFDVSSVSITAWVKFLSCGGSGGACYIVQKNQYVAASPYSLIVQGNNLTFVVNGITIYSPETYNDGNWHYVCGTFNGTTMALYVDSALKSSSSSTPLLNGKQISIGSSYESAAYRPFNGSIDEVRIYSRAIY